MPCSDPRMRGPREVSLFEEPPAMTPAEIAALHEYWDRGRGSPAAPGASGKRKDGVSAPPQTQKARGEL